MTIESKTKTTLKLITIGNNKSNLQKNHIERFSIECRK